MKNSSATLIKIYAEEKESKKATTKAVVGTPSIKVKKAVVTPAIDTAKRNATPLEFKFIYLDVNLEKQQLILQQIKLISYPFDGRNKSVAYFFSYFSNMNIYSTRQYINVGSPNILQ